MVISVFNFSNINVNQCSGQIFGDCITSFLTLFLDDNNDNNKESKFSLFVSTNNNNNNNDNNDSNDSNRCRDAGNDSNNNNNDINNENLQFYYCFGFTKQSNLAKLCLMNGVLNEIHALKPDVLVEYCRNNNHYLQLISLCADWCIKILNNKSTNEFTYLDEFNNENGLDDGGVEFFDETFRITAFRMLLSWSNV
eukprot:Pgem_evm1s12700